MQSHVPLEIVLTQPPCQGAQSMSRSELKITLRTNTILFTANIHRRKGLVITLETTINLSRVRPQGIHKFNVPCSIFMRRPIASKLTITMVATHSVGKGDVFWGWAA